MIRSSHHATTLREMYRDNNYDNDNAKQPYVIYSDFKNREYHIHNVIASHLTNNIYEIQIITMNTQDHSIKFLAYGEILSYANKSHVTDTFWYHLPCLFSFSNCDVYNVYYNIKELISLGYDIKQYADHHDIYIWFREMMFVLYNESSYDYEICDDDTHRVGIQKVMRYIQRHCISKWDHILTKNDRMLVLRLCDMFNRYASCEEIMYYFTTYANLFGCIMIQYAYKYPKIQKAVTKVQNQTAIRIEISQIEDEIRNLQQ